MISRLRLLATSKDRVILCGIVNRRERSTMQNHLLMRSNGNIAVGEKVAL